MVGVEDAFLLFDGGEEEEEEEEEEESRTSMPSMTIEEEEG